MEINSKAVLESWESDLKRRMLDMEKILGIRPALVIVRVGDDPASELYVNNKVKKAKELGVRVNVIKLDGGVDQETLNRTLEEIFQPVILQLPLPKGLNAEDAISYINPDIDVDGLTMYQKGLLAARNPNALEPATAKGVIKLIESETNIAGKKVAIVSRSELIGIPLAHMILQRDGFPVIMHSKVPLINLLDEIKDADIVVTGCGKRGIFDNRHFRTTGQIIIDCSMARDSDIPGVGDVRKDYVIMHTQNKIASGYGHTGPATILGLMDNVVKYYECLACDLLNKELQMLVRDYPDEFKANNHYDVFKDFHDINN